MKAQSLARTRLFIVWYQSTIVDLQSTSANQLDSCRSLIDTCGLLRARNRELESLIRLNTIHELAI